MTSATASGAVQVPPPPPGSGSVREYSAEEAAKLPPPPAGSKYVTLNDGSVIWSQWSNHEKGGPMLMPADISFADNVKAAEVLRARTEGLPFNSEGGPLDSKASTMIAWFTPGAGTMDYQSVYGSGGEYNKSYIDVTNYNYGIVAAAAGYSLEDALWHAGAVNWGRHPFDPKQRTGPFANKERNADMIVKGYEDFKAGRIGPREH